MRDLLFANYVVPEALVRPLVPAVFELDTVTTEDGQACAVVSAVPFRVVDLASSSLPFQYLRFNQINYRAHVRDSDTRGVYFFGMRLNSRMITAGASLLRLPLLYEEIELERADDEASGTRRAMRWAGPEGLVIDFETGDHSAAPDGLIDAEFLTDRPAGFISTGAGGIFRVEVEHGPMEARPARINRARVPVLESLGLLREGSGALPRSALYVEETVFHARQPVRWGG